MINEDVIVKHTESVTGEEKKYLNLFINENFTLDCNKNIFEIEKIIKAKNSTNCAIITYFNQNRLVKNMRLTFEASLIQHTPNAGGSSVESETLSFELFKRYLNAKLVKTEMQVSYFPEGGSITDYVMYIFDSIIAVSVTRAMKFDRTEFTFDDAVFLLKKKLRGILQSTRNSLIKWDKQILHVWLDDERSIASLEKAWFILDHALKSNTVLFLTLATNSYDIFYNKAKKIKKMKKMVIF